MSLEGYVSDLFDHPPVSRIVQTPIARTSDPISSHLAAKEITASGKRTQQQAQAVAAVRAWPGCTSFELAMKTDIDRYVLARRLPEVVLAGLVQKGDPKHCTVTGRLALTWWPA